MTFRGVKNADSSLWLDKAMPEILKPQQMVLCSSRQLYHYNFKKGLETCLDLFKMRRLPANPSLFKKRQCQTFINRRMCSGHRLNKYAVRSPKFIWAPVYSYSYWLRPRIPLPPHLGSYTRALLVSQERRHLFVPPWFLPLFLTLQRTVCNRAAIVTPGLPEGMRATPPEGKKSANRRMPYKKSANPPYAVQKINQPPYAIQKISQSPYHVQNVSPPRITYKKISQPPYAL